MTINYARWYIKTLKLYYEAIYYDREGVDWKFYQKSIVYACVLVFNVLAAKDECTCSKKKLPNRLLVKFFLWHLQKLSACKEKIDILLRRKRENIKDDPVMIFYFNPFYVFRLTSKITAGILTVPLIKQLYNI